MQHPKTPPSQETITIAERLLSQTLGGTIRLNEGEDLLGGIRMNVYRFTILDGPSNAPKSVIVKQAKSTEKARYDPDSATMPAWTLFNEWASLQFLDKVMGENSLLSSISLIDILNPLKGAHIGHNTNRYHCRTATARGIVHLLWVSQHHYRR